MRAVVLACCPSQTIPLYGAKLRARRQRRQLQHLQRDPAPYAVVRCGVHRATLGAG